MYNASNIFFLWCTQVNMLEVSGKKEIFSPTIVPRRQYKNCMNWYYNTTVHIVYFLHSLCTYNINIISMSYKFLQ